MPREYVLKPDAPPKTLQINYSKELNAQQYAAVTAPPETALVIAGAGSGKTRTLTYRVAYLLEQGIPADRILLLTFTNKAAREMMRRVSDLLSGDMSDLWGGTFHSIANRILRRHATALGFKSDFSILDRDDSNDYLKAALAAAKIAVTEKRFPKPDVAADIFSMCVNTRKSMKEVVEEFYPFFREEVDELERLRGLFVNRKRAGNAMDFDDLLDKCLELFQQQPEILEQYQRRFQFILVDEYQDTNQLQSDFIDLLAGRKQSLIVVGDDSQSIYSWRGANFRNILEFPKRYPHAKIYKIEVNYRSTPEILALANAAIAPNIQQFPKVLTPVRKSGPKPALVQCETADEQSRFLATRILELRDEGVPLEEMAVLYRSHFHALELQLELTRRNIPFQITSGTRFFETAHIKDVAAFLKLLVNPADEITFKRIVMMLDGIGTVAGERLWNRWQDSYPKEMGKPSALALALQACAAVVPKKGAVAWAGLVATFAQMENETLANKPGALIRHVVEAIYADYAAETFPNAANRLEDIEQMAVFAGKFNSTQEFLSQVALMSGVTADVGQPKPADDELLRLSTIHQAKGLEFTVVFIIMLVEGLFPSTRSLERPESEEEERRLFYVAVTRAKQELYLTYPLMRSTQSYGLVYQLRSRFLSDLPADLTEEWNLNTTAF